jgi:hypothetical protein
MLFAVGSLLIESPENPKPSWYHVPMYSVVVYWEKWTGLNLQVGTTLLSSAEAIKAHLRGKALHVMHYYRDMLWSVPPSPCPCFVLLDLSFNHVCLSLLFMMRWWSETLWHLQGYDCTHCCTVSFAFDATDRMVTLCCFLTFLCKVDMVISSL